jgi:hypothetical protein
MRICKGDFGNKGMYAEVLGLSDTPTGVKARLKFPDGSRELVSTTRIRILQDQDLEKLGVGRLTRKLWGN